MPRRPTRPERERTPVERQRRRGVAVLLLHGGAGEPIGLRQVRTSGSESIRRAGARPRKGNAAPVTADVDSRVAEVRRILPRTGGDLGNLVEAQLLALVQVRGARQAKHEEARRTRTTQAATPAEAPPAITSVATVKQLMDGIIGPSATVVFDSVGTIVDATGIHENQPRTDAEWATVSGSAAALVESANLLVMGNRAIDRQDWVTMSKALADAGMLATLNGFAA